MSLADAESRNENGEAPTENPKARRVRAGIATVVTIGGRMVGLRKAFAASAAVAILVGWQECALAQNLDGAHARSFVPQTDIVVTTSLAAFVGATEIWKAELASEGCRWCTRNVIDERVRDALHVGKSRKSVDEISGVTAFGVLPAFTIGGLLLAANTQGYRQHGSENILMLGQATIFGTAVSELAKFLAARERPLVRNASSEYELDPAERNLSFFSGHSTIAFALASSMGTIANMRDYKAEPLFWSVGMGLAALVGYMRIAADKHYFTDVLVGALVGTASGILVPQLLHPAVDPPGKTPEGAPVGPNLGSPATFSATYGGSF
ncbi:MAG: phosphatase PAP2 family protein [Polyangiaceae bacterium]